MELKISLKSGSDTKKPIMWMHQCLQDFSIYLVIGSEVPQEDGHIIFSQPHNFDNLNGIEKSCQNMWPCGSSRCITVHTLVSNGNANLKHYRWFRTHKHQLLVETLSCHKFKTFSLPCITIFPSLACSSGNSEVFETQCSNNVEAVPHQTR